MSPICAGDRHDRYFSNRRRQNYAPLDAGCLGIGGSAMPVDMKNIIARTFANLVKQKGIYKVTVTSLIDTCHISRQSFYYHFQDIMDVVEWTARTALQDILSRSIEKETPEEALGVFISSILENRALIRKLLDSQRRGELERVFITTARSFLEEMLKAKGPALPISYADLEVALDFWAFGITGTILKSFDQKQPDARKLAEQLCLLLSGRITDQK